MTPSSTSSSPARAPRLRRLSDAPETLPEALQQVWDAGDAAVVADPGAPLPPSVEAILAGPDTGPAAASPAGTPTGTPTDTSTGPTPLPPGTALVVPTSGSSGAPRAVVLSHAALAASTAASITALGCTPGERWALALPLRHVAGLQVLARARALGTTVHVVDDAGDPHALAAAAAHAEHIALVPTQLVRCLDAGVDLRRFRSVLVGGGPLAPERAHDARAQGVRLVQSYGMTETCGGCVYDGRPLDGVELSIDAAGEPTVDGAGRIRLRGPMRATGYLDAGTGAGPDDAARFTADGWFVTDDLGRIGADGTLTVLGRADAVINTGGVKVDPTAVESLLRSDPAVADVVVVGVHDAEWGERVRAVVVPVDRTATPTLATLRARVTATLPAAHAPRELVLADRIVRDGLGKITAAERARLRALPGD